MRQEIQCRRCGENFLFEVLSDSETRAYRQRCRWVFAVFLAGWLGLVGLIGWMIVTPDSSGGVAVLLAVAAGLLLIRLTFVGWNMYSDGIVRLRVVWPSGATGAPGRKHSIASA